MLEAIFSPTGLLKEDVEFKPGINIILGSYADNKEQRGINGIGKSSLVRLIDYCLLADGAEKLFSQDKYEFLSAEGHILILKLKIRGESHYISRTFGKQKRIVGFGTSFNHLIDYEVKELRKILLGLFFPIEDEKSIYEGEKFRTLLDFFIKDDIGNQQRSDPMDFFPYNASKQDIFAYNFFLLGLPNKYQFRYSDELQSYKELSAHVKAITERLQEETGKKLEEFKTERFTVEQQVTLLENSLKDYNFFERYQNIESDLSRVTEEINAKIKTLHALSRKQRRFQSLYEQDANIDLSDAYTMYREMSEAFADLVKKKLDEVIEFRKSLITNRIRFNQEREKQLSESIKDAEIELSTLEKRRAYLLKQLDEKGELDAIKNTYEQLVVQKAYLSKNTHYLEQIDAANEKMQEIEVRISELKAMIYHDIKAASFRIDSLAKLFRNIVENTVFLSENQTGAAYFDISLSSTRRRNQLPFNVAIEIPKVEALGRFKLRLVAYDLMVILNAVRTDRVMPKFLVHDGVFHGISRKTMIDTLNFVNHQHQLTPGFQYIVTFNEDELFVPAERKSLDGEFQFDLEHAIIAHYTDSIDGMIFKRVFN